MDNLMKWEAWLKLSDQSIDMTQPNSYRLCQPVLLGRGEDCQIVIDGTKYPTVSSHHAQITPMTEGTQCCWQLQDLSSSNGTYVNGVRLLGALVLRSGDRITLSKQAPEFLFECRRVEADVVPIVDSSIAEMPKVDAFATPEAVPLIAEVPSISPPLSIANPVVTVPDSPPLESTAPRIKTTVPAENFGLAKNLWDLLLDRPMQVLSGHKGPVKTVAFSPNGQMLASGSADKTVRLWDRRSGLELQVMTGHKLAVNAVAFSPDGQMLASGGADKMIKLWRMSQGEAIASWVGHGVSAVTFSPDGQTLATGSTDKTVKLWNWRTGTETGALVEQKLAITAIAFSPDGQTLAVGIADRTVKLWNWPNGVEGLVIMNLRSAANVLMFSPDGKALASGCDDKMLRLWQLETNQEFQVLSGYTWQVGNLAISGDAEWLASGAYEEEKNVIKVWPIMV